jgi:sec-independent protein translocase protein TatB
VNIDPEKLVVLVLIALLVLGPKRLPEIARTAGRWMGELKKYTSALQTEMKDVLAEPRQHTNALRDEFRNVLDEPMRQTSALRDEFRNTLNDPPQPIEAAAREATPNFDATTSFDTGTFDGTPTYDEGNFDTSSFDTSNFETTTNFDNELAATGPSLPVSPLGVPDDPDLN